MANGVNLNTWSGNRVEVQFNSARVGLCQSARLSDSYALEDASGIGDVHVQEHVPTKATHTVAVTAMCLFVNAFITAGGSVGGLASLRAPGSTGGYTINGLDALNGNVFDIVVMGNGVAGSPSGALRSYLSCSYDSGDVDVSAHRIIVSSGQFKALDVTGSQL